MMTKKKRFLIVTLIVILVLGIIGTALAIVYLNTDLLKTDEDLFYKYFGQNSEVSNLVDTEWFKQYKTKLNNTPYTSNGKITSSVNESNENGYAYIFNNSEIDISAKTDNKNKKMSSNITFNYDNNQIFKLDVLKTNDTYGIKSDEVINGYLAIENNDLKSLVEKMGAEDTSEVSDKIQNINESKLFKLSDDEKKLLQEKAFNIVKENVTKDNFSSQKNIKININNSQINANSYTLTLTETKALNIVSGILNTVKETIGQEDYAYNSLVEIEKAVETTKNNLKQTNEKNIKIVVYESDNKLAKTQIIIDNNIITSVYDSSQNKLIIRQEVVEEGKAENTTDFNMVEIAKSSSGNGIELTATATKEGEKVAKVVLQYISNGSLNSNKIEDVINFGINYAKYNTVLTIKYTDIKEFSSELEIEELSDNNSAKLNNMSKEQIQQLLPAIAERTINVLQEKDAVKEIIEKISVMIGEAEIHNEVQDEISNSASELDEKAITMFNEKFKPYIGDMSGSSIKTLVDTVVKNNQSSTNKVKITGKATVTDTTSDTSNINNAEKYNVQITSYDNDGRITEISVN